MYDNRESDPRPMMRQGRDVALRRPLRNDYYENFAAARTMMIGSRRRSSDGTCSKYGATYLVCDEKMLADSCRLHSYFTVQKWPQRSAWDAR